MGINSLKIQLISRRIQSLSLECKQLAMEEIIFIALIMKTVGAKSNTLRTQEGKESAAKPMIRGRLISLIQKGRPSGVRTAWSTDSLTLFPDARLYLFPASQHWGSFLLPVCVFSTFSSFARCTVQWFYQFMVHFHFYAKICKSKFSNFKNVQFLLLDPCVLASHLRNFWISRD